MAMVDMKTGDGDNYVSGPSTNPYGYGLCISLTEDQVEALGMKDNPPKPGSTVTIRAIAQVTSVTQDADVDQDGDGIDTTMRMQITAMEVTTGQTSPTSSSASLLYPSD